MWNVEKFFLKACGASHDTNLFINGRNINNIYSKYKILGYFSIYVQMWWEYFDYTYNDVWVRYPLTALLLVISQRFYTLTTETFRTTLKKTQKNYVKKEQQR